jgi:hypothetical protein
MDSLVARLNGPTTRLLLVALASSSITVLALLSFQSLRREHALSSLKKEAGSIPPSEIHRLNSIGAADLGSHPIKPHPTKGEYDEELVLEQLARNRAFFGDDGLSKIRGSFVIIVGAGGVGSWAATMLARSGVGTSSPNFD